MGGGSAVIVERIADSNVLYYDSGTQKFVLSICHNSENEWQKIPDGVYDILTTYTFESSSQHLVVDRISGRVFIVQQNKYSKKINALPYMDATISDFLGKMRGIYITVDCNENVVSLRSISNICEYDGKKILEIRSDTWFLNGSNIIDSDVLSGRVVHAGGNRSWVCPNEIVKACPGESIWLVSADAPESMILRVNTGGETNCEMTTFIYEIDEEPVDNLPIFPVDYSEATFSFVGKKLKLLNCDCEFKHTCLMTHHPKTKKPIFLKLMRSVSSGRDQECAHIIKGDVFHLNTFHATRNMWNFKYSSLEKRMMKTSEPKIYFVMAAVDGDPYSKPLCYEYLRLRNSPSLQHQLFQILIFRILLGVRHTSLCNILISNNNDLLYSVNENDIGFWCPDAINDWQLDWQTVLIFDILKKISSSKIYEGAFTDMLGEDERDRLRHVGRIMKRTVLIDEIEVNRKLWNICMNGENLKKVCDKYFYDRKISIP